MNEVLQGAVVLLIVIQSLILIVLTVALVIIFWNIKRVVDKVNAILQTAENIADGVQRATSSGIVEMVTKGVTQGIKVLTSKKTSRR